jgi:RNA polymerase sigma factor (sigma-70 family)
MSKEIKIGKLLVPVTDEIYREYYKMKRRERYLEQDIKVGRIDINPETREPVFIPSKEDSIERLMDIGQDFAAEENLEDIVADKAMLLILQEALKELDREDMALIENIYYKNLTVRKIAEETNVSHVTIVKKHKKVLDKLKKFFI